MQRQNQMIKRNIKDFLYIKNILLNETKGKL